MEGKKAFRSDKSQAFEQRLNDAGRVFEWADIKQDLKALQQVDIHEDGKHFAIRSECKGHSGKIFQAVKVALPPTIREIQGDPALTSLQPVVPRANSDLLVPRFYTKFKKMVPKIS